MPRISAMAARAKRAIRLGAVVALFGGAASSNSLIVPMTGRLSGDDVTGVSGLHFRKRMNEFPPEVQAWYDLTLSGEEDRMRGHRKYWIYSSEELPKGTAVDVVPLAHANDYYPADPAATIKVRKVPDGPELWVNPRELRDSAVTAARAARQHQS